jgi:hypothetical protein
MDGDGLRQIRTMAIQYRGALLIAAGVVAFAWLFGQHINSNDEAAHALDRVYGGTPHFELVVKDPARPTR